MRYGSRSPTMFGWQESKVRDPVYLQHATSRGAGNAETQGDANEGAGQGLLGREGRRSRLRDSGEPNPLSPRRTSEGGRKKMFSQIAVVTSSMISAETRSSRSVWRSGNSALTSRINE